MLFRSNGWEATLDATLALRPRAVLFENVQGMLTARFEACRDAISARLSQLGYHHGWLPLNAADHGVPQHRRRVFLVGFADLAAWEAFVVPPTVSPRPTVRGVSGARSPAGMVVVGVYAASSGDGATRSAGSMLWHGPRARLLSPA